MIALFPASSTLETGRIVVSMLKIYFRYLFLRLLIPFAICLAAGTMICVMADLYGNINNFLDGKASVGLILWFYTLQVPIMLVQMLPAVMLFSALWTLLGLNRRSELVAFQSGGMSPMLLFSPFFLFAAVWVLIYAYDLSGPAAQAQVTKERILQEIKGHGDRNNTFHSLPYVDNINHRIWFFQTLDVASGKAKDVEILVRDTDGKDLKKYFAHEAHWNGKVWKLSGVRIITYGPTDTSVKDFEQIDTDITTPPRQLSLIVSEPPQLTVPQLSQYINTSTSTPEHLASYRTEWWYRVLHPLSLVVLLLFALLNGMHTDRRGAATGVAWTIAVLVLYTFSTATLMPFGQHNRMPPFVAAIATEVIFGAIGLHLLALKYGWYWQMRNWGKSPKSRKA